MFESIFTNGITEEVSLSVSITLLSLVASLFLGLIISLCYIYISPKKSVSSSFAMSLIILPAIVGIVILLIGGNVARAFSLAGVFTLVRFRSVPGDSRDISFVFLAMAVGLTTGMGYLTLGAAITILLCVTIILVSKLGFGKMHMEQKRLKITIPEDLNYQGVFDELLDKYTKQWELQKVKTTNLGTLYELTYYVVLKEDISEKEFIDELRCRNGNLNILLSIIEQSKQQL